jgi:hypothetical protein
MKEAKGRLSTAWTMGFAAIVTCVLLVTMYARDNRFQAKLVASPIGSSVRPTTGMKIVSASRSKVTMKFTQDNGKVAIVTQLVGKPIRIERNGSAIAIVPQLEKSDTDQVTAKIFKMLPGGDAGKAQLGEAIGELRLPGPNKGSADRRAADGGTADGSLSNIGVKAEVIWISHETDVEESPQIESVSFSPFRSFQGGGGVCCVTCGDTTYCGCAVSMDCGSCCVGVCCTMLM